MIYELIFAVGLVNLSCVIACIVWLTLARVPIYHPGFIYCVYYIAGFVVRPLIVGSVGFSQIWAKIGYAPEAIEIVTSCLLTNASLFLVVIGPYVVFPSWYKNTLIPPRAFHIESPKKLAIWVAILAFIALSSTYYIYSGADTEVVFRTTGEIDAQGGQRSTDTSGYLTVWADFLPPLILSLVLLRGFRPWVLAILLSYVALKLWQGVGRKDFLLTLLAVAYYQLVQRQLRYPNLRQLAVLPPLWMVFELLGTSRIFFRQLAAGDIDVAGIVSEHENSDRSLDNRGFSDTSEFDVATAIFALVPEYTGFNWMTQYFRYFVWIIPRSLWPDKPVYTGIINLQNAGDFYGLTTSLPADLYTNFGALSLILFSGLIGIILTYTHHKCVTTKSAVRYIYYFSILSFLPILFRDGPATIFYAYLISLLCVTSLVRMGGITMIDPSSERNIG